MPVASGIPNAYKYSHDKIMEYSGFNIGNFVFRKAILSLIEDATAFMPTTWTEASKIDFTGDCSTIISCANWLGMGEKFESANLMRARIAETIRGKCLILGLGAQASYGQELNWGENTKRLAKVLASKTTELSVRDCTTANALEKIGINNIAVTGCPSNFINLDLKMSDFNSDYIKENSTWADVSFLISEATFGNPLSVSVINRIYSILSQSQGSSYILQNPDLLPLLYRKTNQLPQLYKSATNGNVQTITKLIKAKSKFFSSVDEWLFSSRFYDISFGMRIHGTMVPLQAGVPSILISHDQRTSGLAETMGVPLLTCNDMIDRNYIRKPYDFLEIFKNNAEKYMEKRKELAKKFHNIITENLFTPSSGFCKYCE